jgi:hypothetical protein
VAVFSGTASAWLSGYDHRMAITVNNGGASPLSYHQFNFTNDTNVLVAAGDMQASGADCRITDASDNLIPFWNETAFNAAGTKIWVNATTLAVGDNTFYMYYGNAGASSLRNGRDTFLLFDDFEYPSGFEEIWQSENGAGLDMVSIADLDEDGTDDFVICFDGRIYGFDTSDGSTVLNSTLGEVGADWLGGGIDVADINGDGHVEIAFLHSNYYGANNLAYIYVVNHTGAELWNKSIPIVVTAYIPQYVKIGDLNSSISGLEIAVMADDDLYVYDKDGNELWNDTSFFTGGASESMEGPCIADFDGDGKNELFVGVKKCAKVKCYNGEDGSEAWNYTMTDWMEDAWAWDVNGDGVTDMVIAKDNELSGPGVLVLYGQNGTKMWSDDVPYSADVEGCKPFTNPVSGECEIAIISRDTSHTVSVYHHNGTIKWNLGLSATWRRHSIDVGDVCGDSDPEIIVAARHTTTPTLSELNVYDYKDGTLVYTVNTGGYVSRVRVTDNRISVGLFGSDSDIQWVEGYRIGESNWSANATRGATAYEGSYGMHTSAPNQHPVHAISENDICIEAKVKQGGRSGLMVRTTQSPEPTGGTGVGYNIFNKLDGNIYIYEQVPAAYLATESATDPTTDWYNWKWCIEGSNMYGKYWADGTSEPGWMANATDTTITVGGIGVHGYSSGTYYDLVRVRKYSVPEPTSQLGAEEDASSGGAYNITLPLGWSIIGWTDSTDRTAHYMGGLIGGNCSYVTERNRTTGQYVNHNMAGPEGENNFAIERGWGYFVSTTAETLWERAT